MIEVLQPYLDNNILNKIIYPVKIDNNLYEFDIHYKNIPYKLDLNTNIDAIVIILTSIAICNKWKIVSKLPIDKKLYDNLLQIPTVYKKYHSKHTYLLGMLKYDEINLILDIPICDRSNIINNGLNCNITTLSLGVDSLHTILLNKDNLTHLMYVNYLDWSTCLNNIYDSIELISNKFNKELIIVDSNIKYTLMDMKLKDDVTMPGTDYAVFETDAIILALSYPLGLNTIYFSGFGNKNFPCMMGENSELIKYFNSNEFNNIGNYTERIKKINYIFKNDIEIIKYIRVCNERFRDFPYKNCSKCNKCLVTILYSYMLGYYDELKDVFLLQDKDYIENLLEIYHTNPNKSLSTKYFHKIYEQFYNLYIKNNKKPLKYIIDDFYGEFIDEDYILYNNYI